MFDRPKLFDQLNVWARALKRDIAALWLAARDSRVPVVAKLTAACVVAYALSPIDLIPDFIPVLGQVDDLIIVPLGIWLVVRLIPVPVMADLRAAALALPRRSVSYAGLVFVILVWLACGAFVVWRVWG